ncbi:MAG: serine/threonine protein kinase, partial [Deltaproteobacteria bacterium]|nr:serine/threonine protein kinase [Deltaproteobacteria bacterium]
MNKAPHRLISPKPNDLIDGHLIVTPAIARGASGVVHEAIDPHGRRCALKILDRESIIKRHKEGYQFQHQSPDEEEKEGRALYEKMVLHFKEEYQILIGLSHLNVAQAYHFGCVDGHFYFTTEFIEGKPISRYAWRQKPLDMIPLFLQALEGLDFIHRNNLLHLDLKPENVLVQEMSGQAHVKIIDFGLALKPSAYGGKMRGTTYYMAPEIIVNEGKPIDERTDLFSFGALMYFCMTWGRLPFPRTTSRNKEALRQLVQKEKLLRLPSAHHLLHPEFVPPFLDIIVARLLERDPEHRIFLSSRAVINALKTHEPERFREERDHRSAYLIPKGNKHIGREEEQTKLFGLLDGLLQNSAKQPPMVMIEGASGL